MIVSFQSLRDYRGQVAMVDGGFDPLHPGHIEYFRQAAALELPVLCNITGDHYVQKKHPPLLTEERRAQVIDAIQYITYTHINRSTTEDVLEELRPKYYVKGNDWQGRLPVEQLESCRRLGIEIVYLESMRDSSTKLWDRYTNAGMLDFVQEVEEFEEFVFSQKAVDPSRYDDTYFAGDWREGNNNYSLESRRQIEGRNPALIKEVFQPRRVLDVGCGPGALMYLLHELGVVCDGIDHSESSKLLAPTEVRGNIRIGACTESMVPLGSYDLVICREVLEHLTVLQVRKTVQAICRATSKYIYVTTRYHPAPSGLLSVTTQFDVDPTHITLLNKEFLRTLFVLDGCRSRPDLEARMDWLNKGRVLVFEKV